MPRWLPLCLFAVNGIAMSASMNPPVAGADAADEESLELRCARIRPGMDYRDALALMGRPPDSTLSGHTAAGLGGDPPAGSYAIDFWNETDVHGRSRVWRLHVSGGTVESVDCDPAPGQSPPASSISTPDT